jgi:hypothetical protein
LLDTLSLMSLRQHTAFLVTLAGVYIVWRSLQGVRAPGKIRGAREVAGMACFLSVFVATYAIGALAPRPMASLQLLKADALAVDFHSHTRASWDGRQSFSAESNRAWHSGAGFDATYISDHGTLSGVIEGEARNPGLSGERTVILPAVEVRCGGQHVIILGATIHEGSPDCTSATVPASTGASRGRGIPDGMITLLTIPARFAADRPIPRSQGIEISDAAPRALDQMERDGALLRRIASADDLALVASSNNHGWGRTAAAWSVLEIGNWRSLTPRELDLAIRTRMATLRSKSVYVIERRRVVPPSSVLALIGTAPAVVWSLFTTLSAVERVSWIVWAWMVWALSRVASRRGRRSNRYLAPGKGRDPAPLNSKV